MEEVLSCSRTNESLLSAHNVGPGDDNEESPPILNFFRIPIKEEKLDDETQYGNESHVDDTDDWVIGSKTENRYIDAVGIPCRPTTTTICIPDDIRVKKENEDPAYINREQEGNDNESLRSAPRNVNTSIRSHTTSVKLEEDDYGRCTVIKCENDVQNDGATSQQISDGVRMPCRPTTSTICIPDDIRVKKENEDPASINREQEGNISDPEHALNQDRDRRPKKLAKRTLKTLEGQLVGQREKLKKTSSVFCPYCKQLCSHFPRHLLTNHAEQEDVQMLKSYPSKSKERINLLRAIRGNGMHIANTTATHDDQLMVVRTGSTSMEIVSCPKCHSYMQKVNLARHLKTLCKDLEPKSSVGRSAIVEGRKVLLEEDKVVTSSGRMVDLGTAKTTPSTLLKDIISTMRKDHVFDMIIGDDFLVSYGNSLADEHAAQPSMNKSISYSLRALAQLFLKMKQTIPTLNCPPDIFRADYWESMVRSIKEGGGWDEASRTYLKPSHAVNVGNVLSLCLKYLPAYYVLRKKYIEEKDNFEQFMVVFNGQYHKRVKKPAISLGKKKKCESKVDLPTTDDVKKLNAYIKKRGLEYVESLKEEFNVDAWIKLNKVTMVSLILFNRKRAGEVERMTVEDYNRKHYIQKDTDIYDALPPHMKIIADRFFHIVIRGKLTRGVSILIPHDVSLQIDVLLEHRGRIAMTSDNYLLFARGKTHFRAHDAMKEASEMCGAQYPERLTSTHLRKHLTSTCQALNMNEVDIDKPSFMGHTSKTHKSWTLEEGKTSTIRNMTIEEVTKTGITSNMSSEDVDSVMESIPTAIPPHPAESESQESSESPMMLTDDPSRKSPSQAPLDITSLPSCSYFVDDEDDDDSPTKRARYTGGNRRSASSSDEEYSLPTRFKAQVTPVKVSARGGTVKRTWSTPEKKCVRHEFLRYLSGNSGLPSERECRDLIRLYPQTLRGRTAQQLKAWVNNQIRKKR